MIILILQLILPKFSPKIFSFDFLMVLRGIKKIMIYKKQEFHFGSVDRFILFGVKGEF
jgi:hypothetical protein